MLDSEYFLEQDFIIFNSALSLRDFVTISRVEESIAYLDEPYEMVFFDIDELMKNGQIFFEQCSVFTEAFWEENQIKIQQESIRKQQSFQREFNKGINDFNKRKKLQDKEYREVLDLPLDGVLNASQIKVAFKTVAKKAHPDVGGNHDRFIEITNARDILLENLEVS